MITSIHALIYSDDVDATRSFLRDVLGFPFVNDGGTEDGSQTGWLIFGTGPSELGVHPTRSEWHGQVYESHRHVEISFMCDDVAATRAELEAKGAVFEGDIVDQGWGLVATMLVPGADPMSLYEPRHQVAFALVRG
ncbi:MAG: VOC family protein [Ilumatobacteraceae bacterium]|nr:VOC family protein [Ilumatobacter sp.]MCO5331214.1 VOC family protein [Ilumatobacteraceae bacterium]